MYSTTAVSEEIQGTGWFPITSHEIVWECVYEEVDVYEPHISTFDESIIKVLVSFIVVVSKYVSSWIRGPPICIIFLDLEHLPSINGESLNEYTNTT